MRWGYTLLLCSAYLSASCKGERVVFGEVSFERMGDTLHVYQTSDKGIIEWKEFSLSSKEIANFQLPRKTSALLHRVYGSAPSEIFGQLKSNGQIYLLNPNGIIIGPEGKIDAAGFIGSCLSLTDKEFLEGSDLLFKQVTEGSFGQEGTIINLGSISSTAGDIFLIAKKVENLGEIKGSEKACLLVGQEVFLQIGKDPVCIRANAKGAIKEGGITNKGKISAKEVLCKTAIDNPYALAICQEGVIEAKGVENRGGKIILSGENSSVFISGKQKAVKGEVGGEITIIGEKISLEGGEVLVEGAIGGGVVLIGGDYQGRSEGFTNAKELSVDKGSLISANALERGDGGKIILWADEKNRFLGKIVSKGGKLGGNGGFVEISSPKALGFQGKVDTLAIKGKTGTLLLDPSNITISTAATTDPFDPPTTYDPAGVASANLNDTDLENALATSSITVSTSNGVGGTGTITVSSGSNITWSAATTLTLSSADGNIVIRQGAGSVNIANTFTGSNFDAFVVTATNGTPLAGPGITINTNTTISAVDGNIVFTGAGGNTGGDPGIDMSGSSSVTTTGSGNITFTGTGGTGASTCHGINLSGSGVVVSVVDGNLTMVGTSNGTDGNNDGIAMASGAQILSTGSGNINLTGTGATATANSEGISLTGSNTRIQTSDTGNIIIVATGGAGTGNSNMGMSIDSGAQINSTSAGLDAGKITITATGRGDGSTCDGFFMNGSASQVESNHGNIQITASSEGLGGDSRGLRMQGGIIQSIGNATITINATGGEGNNSHGFSITSGTVSIITTSSDIFITGTGGSTGDGNHGILLNSSADIIATTGSADINMTGIGSGTSGAGIEFSNGLVLLGSGTLTLDGTGSGAEDIAMTAGTDRIGDLSTTGDIIFLADTVTLNGQTRSTGELTFLPRTPSITIGLGTGATGILNLDATEIATLQDGFSLITIGHSSGTGAVDIEASTFLDPLVVNGGSITVNGAVTMGANPITLNMGLGSTGAFTLNALITSTGVVTVNGGSFNDSFSINVDGQTATLNGGGGTNTLSGPDVANTWTITSNNGGTLNSLTFSNIQNLIGGTANDSFTFTGAFQVAGAISGGGGGVNTLTAPNVVNSWTITGNGAGTITPTGAIGATSFTNIQSLIGGVSDDQFTFTGAFAISGVTGIDGGAGSNTIVGPPVDNDWSISANDAGSIIPSGGGVTSFSNIQNLTGNSGSDTFTFTADGVAVSGIVNGGSFSGNTLDLSAYTTDVNVNLNNSTATATGGITNLQSFIGGTGSNQFTAANTTNNWTFTATNAGVINDVIAFTAFEDIVGGSQDDLFDFSSGFFVTGSVNGGQATNQILAPDVVATWGITTGNGGNVFGFTFSNIQSLIGGNLSDDFVFADQSSLAGRVDGGAPASTNTLDYTAFIQPVIIIFTSDTSGFASNLGEGFINIGNIIGNFTVFPFSTIGNISTQLTLAISEIQRYRLIENPLQLDYYQFNTLASKAFIPYEPYSWSITTKGFSTQPVDLEKSYDEKPSSLESFIESQDLFEPLFTPDD